MTRADAHGPDAVDDRDPRTAGRGPSDVAAPTGPATGSAVRTTAAATLTATIAILPVFLLGATAVSLRQDLGFSEAGLGLGAAVFWAAMALSGVPGGRMVQKLGPTRAIRMSAIVSCVAMVGASTAGSLGWMMVWMVCAGTASGFGNPSTDLALAASVPLERRGLAFGVKQAAVPGATLLAGLAVPALALTVGWRWAFVAGAAIAAPILVLMPRLATVPVQRPPSVDDPQRRRSSVLVLAAAAGLAMVAMTATGAFYVESAVRIGVSQGLAGWLLALGSGFGVAGRFVFAWRLGDHRRPFLAVTALTALGAVGTLVISTGVGGLFLGIGTAVAFGAGWGWNGLFVHAMVRANDHAPAAAMGIVVSATGAGGVIGPVLFGVLVETYGYAVAWQSATGAFLLASGLMAFGARQLSEW